MTNSAPPFRANMAGGVEHLAESDIEAIRDLLRGYGSSRSILKELIQNAEDAGADRLDFFYLPADTAATHSLMRGPSFLVVNNGAFTVEHRHAIRQINLGTKGTDDRAIGRFGKGLKSVFAWCEAFFIVARTDMEKGWPVPSIADLFNPWHGWRHTSWEETFEQYVSEITTSVERCVSPVYPEEPWLAFLFPLRSTIHGDDTDGETEWISSDLPGDDMHFMAKLSKEMRGLAPSLVNLRNLKQITISDKTSGSASSLVWERPDGSDRIPSPDEPEQETAVRGEALMKCQSNGETQYRYTGLAGLLPADSVAHLEQAQDWPKVVKRTPQGRSMAACKAKGRPHFATLITASAIEPKETQGSLDLRWSVFFPIGQQPGSPSPVRLTAIPRHITVNLHGFFFLDSERLRIDGLDNGFKPNGATSSSSCLEWNRIVATQGTLKCLPKAVADFAKRELLNPNQCRELASAIRQTSAWRNFDEDVCRRDTWRPCWRAGEEVWELVSANAPILLIPEPLKPREI